MLRGKERRARAGFHGWPTKLLALKRLKAKDCHKQSKPKELEQGACKNCEGRERYEEERQRGREVSAVTGAVAHNRSHAGQLSHACAPAQANLAQVPDDETFPRHDSTPAPSIDKSAILKKGRDGSVVGGSMLPAAATDGSWQPGTHQCELQRKTQDFKCSNI